MRGAVPDAYRAQRVWLGGPAPPSALRTVRFVRDRQQSEATRASLSVGGRNESLYDASWSVRAVTADGASANDTVFLLINEAEVTPTTADTAVPATAAGVVVVGMGVGRPYSPSRVGPLTPEAALALRMTPGDVLDVDADVLRTLPLSASALSCGGGGCEVKTPAGQGWVVDGTELRKTPSRARDMDRDRDRHLF